MARRPPAPKSTVFPQRRAWATFLRRPDANGVALQAEGNGAWLFRTIPLGPVLDAVTPEKTLGPGRPLLDAIDAIAELTPPSVIKTRQAARIGYREIQIFRLRVPAPYLPPADSLLAPHLAQWYRRREEMISLLLFGVRLTPSAHGASWRETAGSFIDSFVSSDPVPAAFEADAKRVGAALSRVGVGIPTLAQFQLADSWWNRGGRPDPHYIPHVDHLHVFRDWSAVQSAQRAGVEDCRVWDAAPGTHPLSIGAVTEFELPYVSASAPAAQWAARLLASNAVAISIRALVEPAEITRAQLRSMRSRYLNDIADRRQGGQQSRHEQDEMHQILTAAEAQYASGGPATLIDASVLAGFFGRDPEHGYSMDPVSRDTGTKIFEMSGRLEAAWAEMMLGSTVRANPYACDLPATMVAYSGLPSLSTVGDRRGAQAGFTELDRQSVFIDHMAAVDEDSSPIAVFVGQSGSGKACSLDTVLVTPTGSTTFGGVAVGDRLVDSAGRPCTVTHVTEAAERELFAVRFADGQIVRADGDHQWIVSAHGLPDDWQSMTCELADALDAAADAAARSAATMTASALRDLTVATGVCPFAVTVTVIRAIMAFAGVRSRPAGRYPTTAAIHALATRLRQRAGDPLGRVVMTTAEMRADTTRRWAAPLPKPVDRRDLPADDQALVIGRRGHLDPRCLDGSPAQRRSVLVEYLSRFGFFAVDHAGIDRIAEQTAADLVALARSLGIAADLLGHDSARFAMTDQGHPTTDTIEIDAIEPDGRAPARCLTVDSPDASYLLADHIVSHNTQAGLWLLEQYSRLTNSRGERTPIIFPDLKAKSDFSAWVKANNPNNRVYSLDRLLTAGGVFDPIRFAPNPETGAAIAGSILLDINPWGTRLPDVETSVLHALSFGATNGARCTMEAFEIALGAGLVDEWTVAKVSELANANSHFRAVCGVDPEGEPLKAAEGITYIRLGDAHLDLPSRGEKTNTGQRCTLALVRAMIYGSMVALQGREGIVMFDEGWIFLEGSPAEVIRLGRLARAWKVWPLFLTQRVKDITDAEIRAFISRGGILPMEDPDEAAAACRLFGLDPTPARIARITAKATRGEGQGTVPNWASMRALVDPKTRRVERGSIMLWCDQHGRRVPVELVIPSSILALTSSNRIDEMARDSASAP